jgi:hypothetical protein
MAQDAVPPWLHLFIRTGDKICLKNGSFLTKKEERMRQKFQIYLNGPGTHLNIREFAVIDKHMNIIESSMLEDKSFCLLCEEIYENAAIAHSISGGIGDVVAALRTVNFFPNPQYAAKIAEAVVQLFASSHDGTIELFFDDKDMMKKGLGVLAEA